MNYKEYIESFGVEVAGELAPKTNKFWIIKVLEIFEECKGRSVTNVYYNSSDRKPFFNCTLALRAARLRRVKKYSYLPEISHLCHAKWELNHRLNRFKSKTA